jgi:hypothetical protein
MRGLAVETGFFQQASYRIISEVVLGGVFIGQCDQASQRVIAVSQFVAGGILALRYQSSGAVLVARDAPQRISVGE